MSEDKKSKEKNDPSASSHSGPVFDSLSAMSSRPNGEVAQTRGEPSEPKAGSSDKKTDLEKIKQEFEAANKKVDEYLNGWKRAKADYINFKKESEKRQQETAQFANAALILQLLPIYDNFKLAWKHIPEDKKKDKWVAGLEQIKKQLGELLNNVGIEEIKTIGEKFDPELHESVAKEKTDGKKSGEIIEEIKPGYRLFDKTLEPAKVRVAE